jgi:hypothetical protein
MNIFNPFNKVFKPGNVAFNNIETQNEEARKKSANERGLKENVS